MKTLPWGVMRWGVGEEEKQGLIGVTKLFRLVTTSPSTALSLSSQGLQKVTGPVVKLFPQLIGGWKEGGEDGGSETREENSEEFVGFLCVSCSTSLHRPWLLCPLHLLVCPQLWLLSHLLPWLLLLILLLWLLSRHVTAVHVLHPLVALVLAPLTVVIVRVTPARQRKERLLAPNITHERSI